jgi:superfamily II DNA or RNA helicase
MPSDDATYYYRHGLAVLRGADEAPPWMGFDERLEAWVAPGHRFPDLRAWALPRGVRERAPEWPRERPDALGAPSGDAAPAPFFDVRRPRPYQSDALEAWLAEEGRGSVVLPTGSGKSLVAILAVRWILERGEGACIVLPTRALLGQWFNQLADAFGGDRVGAFYGEEKEARTITVTTYHSAFGLLERFGDRFGLLVLDEAHHLADTESGEAKAWHDALSIAPAAHRLGLTATYPDGRDRMLERLVGPVAYRRRVSEMVDRELADFAVERRFVHLTPGERERYDRATSIYEEFVKARGYRDRFPETSDAWRVFMADTRKSPGARRAFRAFRERERIVDLSEEKLEHAGRVLRMFPAERAILFCGRSDQAEALARRFALPLVTAHTAASERRRILEQIEAGLVHAVVSVRVLDEGWDVPAAKLGIILGDTTRGGRRQHQQRLGRILRRQGDQVASLYEVVVADTHEFFVSQKRGAGVRRMHDGQLGLGL